MSENADSGHAAESHDGVDMDKRATGMLAVVKEMRAIQEKLEPKPSLEALQAAEKAVSEIDHRLIKELAEIVEAHRPYGVEPGWFLALQAMREDRCRRDAEMEKRPHVAVLELDDFHRHYETIIMQAERATVEGGDGPVGLVEERSTNFAPRIMRYAGGASHVVQSSLVTMSTGAAAPPIGPALLAPAVPASTAGGQGHQATKPRTGGLSAALKQGSSTAEPEAVEEGAASEEAPPKLLAMIEDAVQDKRERFDISEGFGGSLTWVPETVGLLDSLTHLDLSGNRLLFLPSSIGNLTNLKILDIYGNQLMDLPETIGNLENLLSLDFHSNKIEELPVSIGGCGELVEINGDFNKLRALPESIGQCVNLQKISFALNQLKRLPRTMGSLEHLVELDAHYNQLEALPESICQLTNLEMLNVAAQHFDLQELPTQIGNLEGLTELNISECHIKMLPDSFANLTNLKKLQLQGNPLQDPPITIAELGKEAIFEYIRQRGVNSAGRSKGLQPKDIEITSGVRKFFRKASEAVGAPVATIGRRMSGTPSPAGSGLLGTTPGGSGQLSSTPGSSFWNTFKGGQPHSLGGSGALAEVQSPPR